MDVLSPYRVDLETVANARNPLSFNLEDDFFGALEQQEIFGGKINVLVSVQLNSGGIFQLSIEVEGFVRVACDRCLEPVEIEVLASDERNIASLNAIMPPEDMACVERYGTYDTTWDIYETILLSLPIQRVHEDGDCNPEMLKILEDITIEIPEEEDD